KRGKAASWRYDSTRSGAAGAAALAADTGASGVTGGVREGVRLEQPGSRVKAAGPVLGLLAAWAIFFRVPLFTDQTFYYRDLGLILAPARRLVAELIRAGQWPLWNPYLSGGIPLAADVVNHVFYPPSALYYALPFDLGLKLFILLHYLVAGLGMYALLLA